MSSQIARRFLFIAVLAGLMGGLSALSVDAQGNSVNIDPANYVETVDHPYYPHVPGMRWVYEEKTSEGLERVEIEILPEKRKVMGVQTTVMRDTVSLDGEVIEDTYDYFAQDKDGNVWYFGEDVGNFEKGQLKDKAGSWEAGVDSAMPGIVMFGDLAAHVGETYQQEYYASVAEDAAILLSKSASITIPYGTFDDVVMTYDFNPLNAESHEVKFFASGIGEIRSINLITGEESFLVEFTHP